MKVAVTPFARGLRVAGTMELSGNNQTLRQSRAQAIARGTAQYFDGWDELEPGSNGREPEELWVGQAPLTPDGLPILDRAPLREPLHRDRALHARHHPGPGIRQGPGRLRAVRPTTRTTRAVPLAALCLNELTRLAAVVRGGDLRAGGRGGAIRDIRHPRSAHAFRSGSALRSNRYRPTPSGGTPWRRPPRHNTNRSRGTTCSTGRSGSPGSP